jgi:hypothetical protein
MEPVKTVVNVEVLNTNPAQVTLTYSDGTNATMFKTDWDKQNQ